MAVSRWKLLKRLWILRELALGLLVLAVPTVGTVFTLLVTAMPIAVFSYFGGLDGTGGTVALVLAAALWFVSAAGVGLGFLRAFKRILAVRASGGEVHVGRDGVAWRRWFRLGFAHWSEIDTLERDGDALVLTFSDGRRERYTAEDVVGLSGAAEAALASYRATDAGARIENLRRGDAPVKNWIESAKVLLDEAGYRQKSPPPEVLAEIAADPTAPAEQRIGSALALSRAADDHRTRVRVAIAETADPELAAALEEAIDGRVRVATVQKALRRDA